MVQYIFLIDKHQQNTWFLIFFCNCYQVGEGCQPLEINCWAAWLHPALLWSVPDPVWMSPWGRPTKRQTWLTGWYAGENIPLYMEIEGGSGRLQVPCQTPCTEGASTKILDPRSQEPRGKAGCQQNRNNFCLSLETSYSQASLCLGEKYQQREN